MVLDLPVVVAASNVASKSDVVGHFVGFGNFGSAPT